MENDREIYVNSDAIKTDRGRTQVCEVCFYLEAVLLVAEDRQLEAML